MRFVMLTDRRVGDPRVTSVAARNMTAATATMPVPTSVWSSDDGLEKWSVWAFQPLIDALER